jgi:CheY-like chemotaxis protein/glycine cleavage system H lipoate-binding protein
MIDTNGSETPPARILVIDDEEIVHASIRRILRRQGHTVDAVLSAREGLHKLYEDDHDLVITDLMMPEMNGIELLEQMKKDGLRVPVLMVTGYPTISTAVKALRLGAVDYLAKPFTRQELIGPVNRALRRVASVTSSLTTMQTLEITQLEGIVAPGVSLEPGDLYYLREHSWAGFQQDGGMEVGIEASFLDSVGEVAAVTTPNDGDLVEQGYVSFKLTTASGEVHSVFMPLSGQVVEVNAAVTDDPAALDHHTWIVRIIPTRLETELVLLKKRR